MKQTLWLPDAGRRVSLPQWGNADVTAIGVCRLTTGVYEPVESDELGFQEGDALRVLRVQDDGWWSGYNVENPDVVGLFPSNYVQAQKSVPPVQRTKSLVDAGTTPRPPASSRQRIQQQYRQPPDTPELEDEDEGDDDKVQELRGEYRGHIGAVLQLRRNLEEAERATDASVQHNNPRVQAERERLRHRKNWREREQDEEGVEEDDTNQEESYHRRQVAQAHVKLQHSLPGDGEDTEDEEDESAFPQLQGYMHETDRQHAEAETDNGPNANEENEVQADDENGRTTETADAENVAATLIARYYRRHAALMQTNCEREREAEQQKLNRIAAVCIQRWAAHAYSRQQRRRRRWQHENEAATSIQKWIRMRWACFWRRRVRIERQKRAAAEAQQALEAIRQDDSECLAKETKYREQLGQNTEEGEEEQRRVLQQKLDDEEQQLRQLQLQAVEEEVQRRFLQQAEVQDEGNDPHDAVLEAPFQNAPSPGKARRKVMRKEAVELIRTLVQQQLGETLRDHDAKMDELQRMVTRLQTVVRKQTAMLEDSTDQLVNLRMGQQEQRVPMPPRSNDAGECSFLPRIAAQPSVPRQPVAPSGLRVPRPVMLSKLPVLANGGRASCKQSKKM
ncbi:hypothetical protein PHYPSEUDO_007981 [Phytophthora pseudosyringae]|uniref:SH3 domain-containing protein n=1 Tax=Phytophthora pseudosyringae TaxID=221518 RepID=A0A8T1WCR0_9STRA|nr:hypothetical protein PHYPSEUDO_007981 [Phytophthora pseudosyringae]